MIICQQRGAYGSANAIATLSSLAPVTPRTVYLSGAALPRLSWKRLLNGCSSSSKAGDFLRLW